MFEIRVFVFHGALFEPRFLQHVCSETAFFTSSSLTMSNAQIPVKMVFGCSFIVVFFCHVGIFTLILQDFLVLLHEFVVLCYEILILAAVL